MKRRAFLANAGTGLAATAAAAPAIAQTTSGPTVRWRMPSSFPKSLDTLFGTAEHIARRVSTATGGRFTISTHPAGEIVPPLQIVDAVQNGTVECGQTASYYYVGKDATFALGTNVPFSLNNRQINAWWTTGGGDKLMNEFYAKYNLVGFLAGNTGAQMGGWFRKEIKTLDDLKGLKFRIAGLAGQVLAKLGVVPQQIPAGEIYPALEKGTIDAAEWVGPYDDEKLGLAKVARFYYYPAFWEAGSALHVMVNAKAWADLPADYKSIFEAACAEGNMYMMAKYDTENPQAIKRLVAGGAQLRPFPRAMMEAAYKATQEVIADISGKNADFKRIYEHQARFQSDQILWGRVAEQTYDNFMATLKR
jgi:TRAP-type mannitol/chloroaromatic compound transport system substrate-binding protein